jgi:hypothetical protein
MQLENVESSKGAMCEDDVVVQGMGIALKG